MLHKIHRDKKHISFDLENYIREYYRLLIR